MSVGRYVGMHMYISVAMIADMGVGMYIDMSVDMR